MSQFLRYNVSLLNQCTLAVTLNFDVSRSLFLYEFNSWPCLVLQLSQRYLNYLQNYEMLKFWKHPIPDRHNYVAQRRQDWHGRRWHNYVGTTSAWSPSAQHRHGRRRHNYFAATSFSQRCPNVRKLHWANLFLPTICQRCRPCWKK